jgi:hypothetical protein
MGIHGAKENETYHDGRIKSSRSVDTRRWMQKAAGNSVNGKKSKDTICTEKERLKECGKGRREEREKREERKKKGNKREGRQALM